MHNFSLFTTALEVKISMFLCLTFLKITIVDVVFIALCFSLALLILWLIMLYRRFAMLVSNQLLFVSLLFIIWFIICSAVCILERGPLPIDFYVQCHIYNIFQKYVVLNVLCISASKLTSVFCL